MMYCGLRDELRQNSGCLGIVNPPYLTDAQKAHTAYQSLKVLRRNKSVRITSVYKDSAMLPVVQVVFKKSWNCSGLYCTWFS